MNATNYPEAMRSVARKFRSNPEIYNFRSISPPGEICQACVLGWIGHMINAEVTFIEEAQNEYYFSDGLDGIAKPIIEIIGMPYGNSACRSDDIKFYLHMDRVKHNLFLSGESWKDNASVAADCLDVLADEFEQNQITQVQSQT